MQSGNVIVFIVFAILLGQSIALVIALAAYVRLDRRHVACRAALGDEKVNHQRVWDAERLARAENGMMRAALNCAASKFRSYERIHRAKGTDEGNEKAEANAAMALMCEEHVQRPAA